MTRGRQALEMMPASAKSRSCCQAAVARPTSSILLAAGLLLTTSAVAASVPLRVSNAFLPAPQHQSLHSVHGHSSPSCCERRHQAGPPSPPSSPSPPSVIRRQAMLPPFDSPLDPATLEGMAAASSAAGSTGGALNEVTSEQLWVGFIAGVFPFVWAGFEFWKRIDVQQRCGVCQGSGLVYENASGKSLSVPRKCYACGGFLPWAGWRRFWLSNLDIGNGGVLQRPAADYEALSEAAKRRRAGG
ncbi:hypothetical protein Naga_100487g1, partial [Nannochloropsis gaditana]